MLSRFSSGPPGVLLFAALIGALLVSAVFGQSAVPVVTPSPVSTVGEAPPADADAAKAEVKPDLSDPSVVRAQQNLDRIRGLVRQGILPPANLVKAQEDLNDALDASILRTSAFATDLVPEQADQMVTVAERIFLRRQHRAMQDRQLVTSGVLSRSEAEASSSDVVSAKLQLDLAIERAQLIREMAVQKSLAQVELDAETHPEWNGKVYTRYDGNGVFTRADFDKISAAYLSTFGHMIPVSADGQTAVHTALGFNHAGRIDIALNPDQREGVWLLRYLERNHIPYFAFRAAVAHKATGAHIHLGPSSTRLATTKSCCGS